MTVALTQKLFDLRSIRRALLLALLLLTGLQVAPARASVWAGGPSDTSTERVSGGSGVCRAANMAAGAGCLTTAVTAAPAPTAPPVAPSSVPRPWSGTGSGGTGALPDRDSTIDPVRQ